MKTRKNFRDELDPTLVRLFDFIYEKGGVPKVAESIGRTASTLHAYKRGILPGIEILREIKKVYSDFDINYIVDGIKMSGTAGIESQEVKALRYENQLLKMALESKGVHLG